MYSCGACSRRRTTVSDVPCLCTLFLWLCVDASAKCMNSEKSCWRNINRLLFIHIEFTRGVCQATTMVFMFGLWTDCIVGILDLLLSFAHIQITSHKLKRRLLLLPLVVVLLISFCISIFGQPFSWYLISCFCLSSRNKFLSIFETRKDSSSLFEFKNRKRLFLNQFKAVQATFLLSFDNRKKFVNKKMINKKRRGSHQRKKKRWFQEKRVQRHRRNRSEQFFVIWNGKVENRLRLMYDIRPMWQHFFFFRSKNKRFDDHVVRMCNRIVRYTQSED